MKIPSRVIGLTSSLILVALFFSGGAELLIYSANGLPELSEHARDFGIMALVLGFLIFMLRTKVCMSAHYNKTELRQLYRVAFWLYIPPIVFAVGAIVAMVVTAMIWPSFFEGESERFPVITGLLLFWLIIGAFSWFDFMLFEGSVRKRKAILKLERHFETSAIAE